MGSFVQMIEVATGSIVAGMQYESFCPPSMPKAIRYSMDTDSSVVDSSHTVSISVLGSLPQPTACAIGAKTEPENLNE